MKILGIETSCDETAASVVGGKGEKIKVFSNVVSSQIEIHKKYGGVVPEVAAREHVLNILPVINEALEKAEISQENSKHLDAIAVAQGPGLVTSLITGVETAKSLAFAWDLPLLGINHIEAHIYANFINTNLKDIFPAMVLTVSGGHTMLILIKAHGSYEIIGDTRDDAAGEAFDKAAQLLDIGYPGGPVISQYAQKFKGKLKIEFPRPMTREPNFDFSFSGLKTSILYKIKKDSNWKKRIPEYCYAFQEAVIDVLITKTLKAAQEYGVSNIMLAGGVSANQELRQQLQKRADKEKLRVLFPDLEYTTDNAAMVASAGYFRARNKNFSDWREIKVNPNLEL